MELSKIFNVDCIGENGMCLIPSESVDMILCDLPFGTTQNKWDSIIPLNELWNHYERIIKPNGAIVLTADGVFTAKLMLSNEKIYRYSLIWDKQRGCDFLNANRKPLKSHEDILIFYKGQPTFNKQYWYSTPYKKTKNGTLSDNYGSRGTALSESEDGKRNPLTILSFPRDGDRKHPTQKPVALFEYLIRTYTNEGDIVLDNCAGSFTTAIACDNTNRQWICMEKEKTYCDIGAKRISENLERLKPTT